MITTIVNTPHLTSRSHKHFFPEMRSFKIDSLKKKEGKNFRKRRLANIYEHGQCSKHLGGVDPLNPYTNH